MFTSLVHDLSILLHVFRSPYLFALLITVTVLCIAYFSKRHSLSFFLSIGLTFSLTHITKSIFAIPRPDLTLVEATGYRFPSLHASIAGAFFASLWFYAWHRYKSPRARLIASLLTILAIGFVSWSRVYLGVHLPIDVVIGSLFGAAIAVGVHLYFHHRPIQ